MGPTTSVRRPVDNAPLVLAQATPAGMAFPLSTIDLWTARDAAARPHDEPVQADDPSRGTSAVPTRCSRPSRPTRPWTGRRGFRRAVRTNHAWGARPSVQTSLPELYIEVMEVAITAFRAALRAYVDRARRGEDVVLTDRGLPVARLVAVDAAPLVDQLEREGVLTAASAPRPRAGDTPRAKATGPVADLVSEHRR